MFVKLTGLPRLPVEAEYLPTLFGDTQIRVTVTTAHGRETKDYAVKEQDFDFLSYAVLLKSGENEYAVAVNSRGEGSCDCESFEFETRKTGSLCKHLFACCRVGLLPWPAGVNRPNHKPESTNVCTDESPRCEQPAEDRAAARAS